MGEQHCLLQTGAPQNKAASPCRLGAPAGFDKWNPGQGRNVLSAFLVSVVIVTSQYQTQVVSELGLRAITRLAGVCTQLELGPA